MSKRVLLIQSEVLGRGEDKLGAVLMAKFLSLLGESSEKPSSIVFWNTGVRLVCEGSPVLDSLKRLEEQGTQILACTTCLDYFGLTDKLEAGEPTTMVKSIQSIVSSEIVCL
jgi:selenium metabolism protein YedF